MKAAEIVQIDIDKCVQVKRLHGTDKHKRDLVVYFLWNKGITTNEKIGHLFNMSYSAFSHCVKIFKEKMNKDKKMKNQFENFFHNTGLYQFLPFLLTHKEIFSIFL